MRCRLRQLAACIVWSAWTASPTQAQLCPTRLFNASAAGVPIDVTAPQGASICLYDPAHDEPVAQASVQSGQADLAELFPDLRSIAGAGVIFAQLIAGGLPIGAPIVIEPLALLPRAGDAWSSRVVRALDANDRTTIESLLRMPPKARESLRQTTALTEPGEVASPVLRVYEERLIALSTSEGVITIALRADAAPRTAFHFRTLVEGGFFDGTALTPMEDASTRAPVLIRAGTGWDAGEGGCGWTIPYEPSRLPNAPGVVSIARSAGDPNGASSQFIIVLSASHTQTLDECAVPFGVVVGGAKVISAIARRGSQPTVVIEAHGVAAPPHAGTRKAIEIIDSISAAEGER